MDAPTESPQVQCLCCGTLDAVYQPSLYREMPPYWYLTCWNPNCDLFGFSFSSRQYPPENIAIYLRKGEVQS